MADYQNPYVDPYPGATQSALDSRRRYAMSLLQQGGDSSPTKANGIGAIARALQGAMGGYLSGQADQSDAADREKTQGLVQQLIGAGGQPQAPQPGTTPPPVADNAPRGIRNNNPGNIEDGPFAQKMPGYAGSDGRFAKFEQPQQGMTAMDSLLASYGSRGINTVGGVINRWAPPTDNNPTSAYASTVAKGMGIDPNARIDLSDPSIRAKLAPLIGKFENGQAVPSPQQQPVQVASLGSGMPAAPQLQPAGPQMAQAQPPQPQLQQGGDQNRAALIAQLLSTRAGTPFAQAVLPGLIANKPELKESGTDPITGQKSYQEYDPNSHTMRPVGGAPGTAQAQAQPGMLAQGVSQIDHNLTGDAYLKQFGPEIQSAVKSYMNGDVLPTGNPRMAGIANAAKTIAQKYGQDTGQPVSDTMYAEKRKYRTELGSNQPSTAGGQAKAFNQGIEHMGALASTLEKLDNSNGFGIPLIADAINAGRQMTSTEQSSISDKARGIGQTLSGEVGKLFSGSAGGGVEERRLTRDRFDSVKSPKQMAAALEGTLETMRGGLTALEGRRDQILGPSNDVKFITADTEKKIAQIEAAISRLKGEKQGGTAPAASEQGGLPPGWSVKVH